MDHQRVRISVSSASCGILDISNPAQDDIDGVIYQIASYLYHPCRGTPAAMLLFSTVADGFNPIVTMGEMALLDYVTPSRCIENPKTGNVIQAFLGEINHKNFKQWYVEKRIEKLKRV